MVEFTQDVYRVGESDGILEVCVSASGLVEEELTVGVESMSTGSASGKIICKLNLNNCIHLNSQYLLFLPMG